MRYLLIGIVVALLVGLMLGVFFSSELRSALRSIGENMVVATSTVGKSVGGGSLATSSFVSNPTSIISSETSSPSFHGPTSQPHVIGPTGPPPGY